MNHELPWAPKPRGTEAEFYPTPMWLAEAMARLVLVHAPLAPTVLDAGCGDGRLARCVRGLRTTVVDIDADHQESWPNEWTKRIGDFLALPADRVFDVVISNPPFTKWLEFAEHCLSFRDTGGTVLLLAFANILGGQERARWWAKHPPSEVVIVPKRPQFLTRTHNGGIRDTVLVRWTAGDVSQRLSWLGAACACTCGALGEAQPKEHQP